MAADERRLRRVGASPQPDPAEGSTRFPPISDRVEPFSLPRHAAPAARRRLEGADGVGHV